VELGTMAASVAIVALVIRDAKGTRREGLVMLAAYAAIVVLYYVAGDR
jgi:Ca2+/H+ antiporter